MKNKFYILSIIFYLIFIVSAKSLVIGSDEDEILIDANFSGQDLLVFGAFYSDPSQPRDQKGDILIEVVGPKEDLILRKKESHFGFWLNSKKVKFRDVPSFYYLSSTKRLDEKFLKKNNIGLLLTDQLPEVNWSLITSDWGEVTSNKEREEFYIALLRNKTYDNLFRKTFEEIQIIDGNLFKTNIPIPNTVPIGSYKVNVYLILKDVIQNKYSYNFIVKRVGIENMIFNFANNSPLLYGIVSLLIALIIGWISADLFRRLRKA